MGREGKINKKLTTKQTVFVREIIKGSNATQAALAAYQTDNVNSAKVIGSRLLTNVNIQESIDELLRSEGLSPSVLAKNIGNLANSIPQKVSGETVLKANVELLKLQGVYPNNKVTVQRNFMTEKRAWFESLSMEDAKEEVERLKATNAELLADIEELEPGIHPN